MATKTQHPGPGEVPCPDPSAHPQTSRLQDQASAAALSSSKAHQDQKWPLDSDNKLSSASAAASLKYARPQDLPSFPSVGVAVEGSGLSAANLANTNYHSPEYPKTAHSAAANKAALLANKYKMGPLWQPELSAAGSKAALLAHRDGGKLDLWMPEPHAEGNSAAHIAMSKNFSPRPIVEYTEDGHKKALLAATQSLSRKRAGSTPVPPSNQYPDQANAVKNALNAATSANRSDAARIHNIGKNVDPRMWTEHPPVAIEVEEKKHQEALRASAVSMAKQMYAIQQKHFENAKSDTAHGVEKARGQPGQMTDDDIKREARQYVGLQEAAQRLAAERLAKLEPDEASRYRQHYGYSKEPHRSRLSIRRSRRRANSEGEMDSDDEAQARRIRMQMSNLTTTLGETDAKKKGQDRAALLAAAQKSVHERIHAMDEKVFMETGKQSPAMKKEWEEKARAKATADSEGRMKNHGKVHIGGGKFLDQSELEAIAQERLQPTLDMISEAARKQREEDEARRVEEAERIRVQTAERHKDAEEKARVKRIMDEEKRERKQQKEQEKVQRKAERAEEKATHRRQKDDEKAAQQQQREIERLQREEERRNAEEEKRRIAVEKRQADEEMRKAAAIAATTAEPTATTVEPTAQEDATTVPDVYDANKSIESQHARTTSTTTGAAASTAAAKSEGARPSFEPLSTQKTSSSGEKTSEEQQRKPQPLAYHPVSPEKKEFRGLKGILNKLKKKKPQEMNADEKKSYLVAAGAVIPSSTFEGKPSAEVDASSAAGAKESAVSPRDSSTADEPTASGQLRNIVAGEGRSSNVASGADRELYSDDSSSVDLDEMKKEAAGKAAANASNARADNNDVSSLSSSDDEEYRGRQRSRPGAHDDTVGQASDDDHGDFEDAEEGRDGLEELQPPPKNVIGQQATASRSDASPARESRFSEQL